MFAPKSELILLLFTGLTAVTMLFVPLSWYVLIPFVLGVISTVFLMFFFRDPTRVAPDEEGILVAPTDGRVIGIQELEDGVMQVQVLLSVFNVHVNRMPAASTVLKLEREKGGHWPAWFRKNM